MALVVFDWLQGFEGIDLGFHVSLGCGIKKGILRLHLLLGTTRLATRLREADHGVMRNRLFRVWGAGRA